MGAFLRVLIRAAPSILNLVIGGGRSAKSAVGWVWEATVALFGQARVLIEHQRGGWAYIDRLIGPHGGHLKQAFTDFYLSVRHVHGVTIPTAARWSARRAEGYAKTITGRLDTRLRRVIVHKDNALRAIIRAVEHLLMGLIRAALLRIGTLWRWVFTTGLAVAALVLAPPKLVKWILADLVAPLLRFVITHLAPLVALALRLLLQDSELIAAALEDGFTKVL